MSDVTAESNSQRHNENAIPQRSLSARFAIAAIRFYRQHLSRRKKWKCAQGAMGGKTCSTQGLENFLTLSFHEACKATASYVRECNQMAKIFRIAVGNDEGAAIGQISEQFGKTAEEAKALVGKAHEYRAKTRAQGQDGPC